MSVDALPWNAGGTDNKFLRLLTVRNAVLFVIAAMVLYLTLVPLIMILYGTFTDGPPGTNAGFTPEIYVKAFGSPKLIESGVNSVLVAAIAGFISFVLFACR